MVETKRNSTAKEPFSAGWEAISCNTVSFRSAVSSEQVSPVLVEARVRGLAKSLPATSICRSVVTEAGKPSYGFCQANVMAGWSACEVSST